MPKILIIDDGVESRANKTRMYKMLTESRGCDVITAKLADLSDVNGFDLIVTDLDGSSVADN